MIIFRRLLVLFALMFWQGGLMFYGGVVIPVGSEILGSHREQSHVTRAVTHYLHAAGAVALTLLLWDGLAEREQRRYRRYAWWLLWSVLVLLLGGQVWLHGLLDAFFTEDTWQIADPTYFQRLHQGYLLISTIQWLGVLILLGLVLQSWRDKDRTAQPA